MSWRFIIWHKQVLFVTFYINWDISFFEHTCSCGKTCFNHSWEQHNSTLDASKVLSLACGFTLTPVSAAEQLESTGTVSFSTLEPRQKRSLLRSLATKCSIKVEQNVQHLFSSNPPFLCTQTLLLRCFP